MFMGTLCWVTFLWKMVVMALSKSGSLQRDAFSFASTKVSEVIISSTMSCRSLISPSSRSGCVIHRLNSLEGIGINH